MHRVKNMSLLKNIALARIERHAVHQFKVKTDLDKLLCLHNKYSDNELSDTDVEELSMIALGRKLSDEIAYMHGDRIGNNSNVAFGTVAEKMVENYFQQKGYETRLSPGSRGAADLICWNDFEVIYIQIKSSRTNTIPNISDKDIDKLIRLAEKNNAVSLIIFININGTYCYDPSTGQEYIGLTFAQF